MECIFNSSIFGSRKKIPRDMKNKVYGDKEEQRWMFPYEAREKRFVCLQNHLHDIQKGVSKFLGTIPFPSVLENSLDTWKKKRV